MIERRYPIQTVLAERKMFAGGGAVLPQQMMPQQQQMMPQQQQSGGILASSGPLLDAVAAGAINPDGDGGASLSDVQGFANGGLSTSQDLPYITRYDFENQTGGPSDRPDSRFLPESGMTTDISAQLTGATDEQLRQFISSVDPITQGYVLSQAQTELDRRNSLNSLNTQPVNSLTPLTPSPLFQPDGDESVGEDPPDFADAVTEGPDANMASLDISTNPNFTGYMDEESTSAVSAAQTEAAMDVGFDDSMGPSAGDPSDPNEDDDEDGAGSEDEGAAAADGGYFTSRMYNANSGQSGYPNMTAAEEIENGVQRFRRGGSIGPYNPDPRATYDNNSFLLDGQASTRIVPEQIANPQTVAEMMAAMSETGLDTSNADDISPGLMERVRNYLGTNDGSSVAGKGNLLNAMRYTASPSSFMGSTSSLPGQPIDENDPGKDPGQLVDVSWETNTPKPDLETMAKRAAFDDRSGREDTPILAIEGVPTGKDTEFAVAPVVSEAEAEAEAEPGSELDSTAGDRGPGGGATEDLLEAEEAGAAIFDKQVTTAAEVFKKVFNDNSPDKTKSAMAKAVEDFKSAMPEYEGMSESEKGYAIMEAGLRIMAGKSPDALTNIAEGLKGLGPKFAKDAKDKRAWNRQVELSAAKYGLETVAKEKAIEQADERKVFFFYDRSKKSKTNPQGKLVTYSRADMLANKGEIPEGLVEKDIVLKSIAATNSNTARLQKLITDNAKIYRIGSAEADRLEQNLEKSREAFVSGEIGITLLGLAKEKVAKGEVTGFGNAGKELLRRAFDSVGIKTGKKYTSITAARADIKRAFQSLIPITLGSRESANSISNRDVEFLADAYINSGFLKDDIFSFATVNSKVLGEQLDGAIEKFRQGQKQGLASYDKVLRRIQTAEEGLSGPVALGVTVPPGPFSRTYFQSTLDEMNPYVEKTRSRLAGRKTKPMFTQKSFGAIKGYDIINGKYFPKSGQ